MWFVGPIVPDEGATAVKTQTMGLAFLAFLSFRPRFSKMRGSGPGSIPWDDADLWDIDKLSR